MSRPGARQVLVDLLPQFVQRALLFASLDANRLTRHIRTVEDADHLRSQLAGAGLVAFVADGEQIDMRRSRSTSCASWTSTITE